MCLSTNPLWKSIDISIIESFYVRPVRLRGGNICESWTSMSFVHLDHSTYQRTPFILRTGLGEEIDRRSYRLPRTSFFLSETIIFVVGIRKKTSETKVLSDYSSSNWKTRRPLSLLTKRKFGSLTVRHETMSEGDFSRRPSSICVKKRTS